SATRYPSLLLFKYFEVIRKPKHMEWTARLVQLHPERPQLLHAPLDNRPHRGGNHPLLDLHRIALIFYERHLGSDSSVFTYVPRGVGELRPPVRPQIVNPIEPSRNRELSVQLRVLPEEGRPSVVVYLEDF